ncbi:MAG: D-aminoacyl-tRNA deacylase [Syntrophales bacterium]|nr:D-aminoacyl-tRNA deacylase [Syntrophales bacterium]
MRAVIQRVDKVSVHVDGSLISETGRGVIVFLGVEKGDQETDADYLLQKILNLRIFEDRGGKMNLSLLDMNGQMMIISQFTLLADCSKGRRPSFIKAEEPELARRLYEYFLKRAENSLPGRIGSGEFQADMKIDVVNDGPVTILLDSRRSF